MMQKSTIFTAIFRVKKCYFHYDFACKKVPLSLRYAKNIFFLIDTKMLLNMYLFDCDLTDTSEHLICCF
jgi:hypothetical protein